MSEPRPSARAIAGALLLVAGLLLLATGIVARTHAVAGVRDDPRPAATTLRARLEQALITAARALEPKAATAAGLSEIVSGLDLAADPHTFEDLLQNEDWWAPYRGGFPLSGVVTSTGALAMLGPDAADVSATPVVQQARETGVASGTMGLGGQAYMLAAARVPKGKRVDSRAVVVLGAAIDRPVLQGIADAAGAPAGLSDGKHLLAAAGAGAAHPALAALVGREARAAGEGGVVRLDGARSGVALPLDRGLWLLGLLPAPPPPEGAQLGLIIAAAGALLGTSGLLLRRSAGRLGASAAAASPTARRTGSGTRWRPPSREVPAPLVPGGAGAASATDSAAPAPAPPVERPPAGQGVTLGRYRLLERIGEGGMAEIFVAAAHGPEGFVRNFVVKRMHPHLARSRDAVNQFIDEGRLQSGLVHSNIVPVFDFGRAGEEYFLALEYINGRDVERLVRRHVETFGRSLPVQVAFYILHEVLDALAYAHARTDQAGKSLGIVHRDVSPGNILVSLSGEVKLSDFGIAKAEGRVSRTDVGLIKGNVSFMSPEQARGDPVDLRSDLFSAAVVLYYCLTAQFLYRDEQMFNRLVRAAIGPETAELTQLADLTPIARDVLRKALAMDADKRYQSAREFGRDLLGHFTAGRAELADLMATLFPELKRAPR
jgi:hypothetical protein